MIADYLTTWYGVLGVLLILKYVVTAIIQYRASKRLGCAKVTHLFDSGFLGIRMIREVLDTKSKGRLVDYSAQKFLDYNASTGSSFSLGSMSIMTKDPENIKAVLATQFNDFDLGTRHKQFYPLLGDGIFTLDNQGWKHSRAMLRPQFAREQVSHVKLLEPHIQNLIAHIKNAKGRQFDIQELFFKLTLDSGTEFLFSESTDSLVDDSIGKKPTGSIDLGIKARFPDAFNEAQNIIFFRSVLQKFYWALNSKAFKKNCEDVHKFASFFVDKALSLSTDELEKTSSDGNYIFLYELVKQTRDPTVLRDQSLNILLAGRDTTAGLLSFVFFELARNPQVFEKLKTEIYERFGFGDESDLDNISFETLKKCDYLKAVLNECLRLYPSVPQNFRVANKNTSLPRGGGKNEDEPIFIPKGTSVKYFIRATHRDQMYYGKDAEVFRPERWFEPEVKKLGWAFLPFNGGPRICLGQQFALVEASYTVVRLLQTFPNIQSFDSEYPPRTNAQLTMCHKEGVFIGLS